MAEFDQLQIRKLDGGLLLIFHELLARRRASAVARQLGLSPSSISHALTRLRDVFRDPLFVRRSHGLEPTQRALELAPRIEALIEAISEAVGDVAAFDPAVSRRRFRIGAADPIASLVAPALTRVFRDEAPQALFALRPAFLDWALQAVRRGEIDVALGVFRQIPPTLSATKLFDDHYCVIAREGHPEIVGGVVSRGTYASAGHVFVGNPDMALAHETPVDRETMNDAYGALPGPDVIRTHAYVSLWETAMLVVANTDALADCPYSLAVRHAPRLGLQVLAPPFRPFRFTVEAVRRADTADAGLDWLIRKLEAVAAS
ncbi:MAG TPA: LysR substrate-binding domain-containing protein [Caulobacteraceae bacterium]|jgi:DNA-binding transcriptional LysR family regulator